MNCCFPFRYAENEDFDKKAVTFKGLESVDIGFWGCYDLFVKSYANDCETRGDKCD